MGVLVSMSVELSTDWEEPALGVDMGEEVVVVLLTVVPELVEDDTALGSSTMKNAMDHW